MVACPKTIQPNRMSAPTTPLTGLAATLQSLLADHMAHPAALLFGTLLVLAIVYAPLFPASVRMFADTLLGRVFGIAAVFGITQQFGWIYGALALLAFLLVLSAAPRLEGFTDGGVALKEAHGPRWFVERMLGERPDVIQTDRVETLPVQ
jgi:hypothetical protein